MRDIWIRKHTRGESFFESVEWSSAHWQLLQYTLDNARVVVFHEDSPMHACTMTTSFFDRIMVGRWLPVRDSRQFKCTVCAARFTAQIAKMLSSV